MYFDIENNSKNIHSILTVWENLEPNKKNTVNLLI